MAVSPYDKLNAHICYPSYECVQFYLHAPNALSLYGLNLGHSSATLTEMFCGFVSLLKTNAGTILTTGHSHFLPINHSLIILVLLVKVRWRT